MLTFNITLSFFRLQQLFSLNLYTFYIQQYTQGGAKKWKTHGLCRYLHNTGFVFVVYRSRATKTKPLIFFAILLMLEFILNILCDVTDVFITQIYDTAREKMVDFLRTHVSAFIEPENWPPTGLESRGLLHIDTGFFYSSLFTDSRFETLST